MDSPLEAERCCQRGAEGGDARVADLRPAGRCELGPDAVHHVRTPLSGALAYSGPTTLLYALDVLVPQLTAAADNDLATAVADLSNAA
jgi:hypothetical protein